MTTRRQKADAVKSRLNTAAVSGRSGARLMRVTPQREAVGELYVRPGTCALLSDLLHNIPVCPTGQNLGGGNDIGAPPTTNSGGRVPPSTPVFTPMDVVIESIALPRGTSKQFFCCLDLASASSFMPRSRLELDKQPLYLALFGRNLQSKFELGVVSPQFGERGGHGVEGGILSRWHYW